MAFEISMLSVDLMAGRTMVVLKDDETDRQIQLMIKNESPEGAVEAELRDAARASVRQALQEALAAV